MSDIVINSNLFSKRVKSIQKALAAKNSGLNGADSIFILVGKTDENVPYRKSSVLHSWLLGYEFPTTALLITKDETVFITSVGKGM